MMRALMAWLVRPRKTLIDAVPRRGLVQALWVFPYMSTVLLFTPFVAGRELTSTDVVITSVVAVVAVAETLFLLLWLRRPTEGKEPRK